MAELSFRVDIDGQGFAKVKKLSGDFKKADKSAQGLSKSIKKNELDFRGAGLAITAAATGIGYFAKQTLDSIDAQTKASRATGIQTELYTGLTHVMNLGGVSQEKMNTALKRFAKNINDASMGIGTGKRAFEQLGIELKDNNGLLKSQEDLMLEVADVFKDMENGAQKTAIAQDIFGKSGTELINVLNGGSEAMREQLEEAEALGIVFSEDLGKNVEAAQDAFTKVGTSIRGLFTSILNNEELMARFTATFDDITESMKWWNSLISNNQVDELTRVTGEYNEELNKLHNIFAKLEQARSDKNQPYVKQLEKEYAAQERIVESYELQLPKLRKVTKEKELADKKEQEAQKKKGRTSQTTNKKISESEKARREAELDSFAQFLKEEDRLQEEREKQREKNGRDFVEQQLQTQLDIEKEFHQANKSQFDLRREEEAVRHQERMSIIKGQQDEELMQEALHSANMKAIAQDEADYKQKLKEAEWAQLLETAGHYAQAGDNITAAMGLIFTKNKKIAKANIIAQGAVAFINGLATQPFLPLGLSMSALAVAQTGRALAEVDRAKAFVGGGVVNGGEQFIRVNERGAGRPEAVLNSQAVASLGGETINALNNGRIDALERNLGVNSGPQVVLNMQGVFGQDTVDQIKDYFDREYDNR